jgi:hypothetical protein
MKNSAYTRLSLLVALVLSLPAIAQAQYRFASAASQGFCLTNSGGAGNIVAGGAGN